MTKLRQRLIDDLTLRGYTGRTIETYVGIVARLAQFFHTAPDQLTEEQLRTYLLRFAATHAPASVTQALSALRFFYEQTLGQRCVNDRLILPTCDRLKFPTQVVVHSSG